MQSVQLVDYIVAPGSNVTHTVELDHDNILVYCYDGAGRIGPQDTKRGQVVRFVEAEHGAAAGGGGEAGRTFTLEAGQSELRVLVFAGKRLNQPIAWHVSRPCDFLLHNFANFLHNFHSPGPICDDDSGRDSANVGRIFRWNFSQETVTTAPLLVDTLLAEPHGISKRPAPSQPTRGRKCKRNSPHTRPTIKLFHYLLRNLIFSPTSLSCLW